MKPKLLLHTCCAPCLIGTLPKLNKVYEVVVYFYNPNIHPKDEYELRKKEVIKYCSLKSLEFIEGPYDVDYWFERIRKIPNYMSEPEGGKRCYECFKLRLEKTVELALKRSIKLFSTTLTLGDNKNAGVINEIGNKLANESGLFFVQADYKKKGGYVKSIEESKRLGIYRQNYCGCVYSMPHPKTNTSQKSKQSQ